MEGTRAMPSFDAIVIGTGQAGPSLARRLVAAGRKVAVIERKHFGGTCVNTGCTPTKALVASAYAAHVARRHADYGVTIGGPIAVDMKAVKARKDAIVAPSRNGVERSLKSLDGCTVYQGHGRFISPNEIQVGETVLSAPQIFINVGGRATVPPMPGLDQVAYLTNSTMVDLDVLPAHLIVVGGSYIGLEFAQAYRRFGSKVTVIEMAPRLIAREDEDVSMGVADVLESEGIALRLNATCLSVSKHPDGVAVNVDCTEGAPQVIGSHLLLAVGRRPNTDDLGLDWAGVATDARGFITVDDQLRTSVPGVWALGDVNGRGAFTHTSYNDFQIVAGNLLDGETRRVGDRIPIYALFIDPPLGRVGMSEAEVRARGKPALVGVMPMTRVGRARERGETQGFMKVLVDAGTERILGASLLCIEGDEIVHMLLAAMAGDLSYKVIERAVHIHPTVSELIPTLLESLTPLAPA
jgi:pyruvate/2-oxoglutarate dehydrogenase complex dihydrolipoamide dehydrogenase (E3) component